MVRFLAVAVGAVIALGACSSGDDSEAVAWTASQVVSERTVTLTYPIEEYRSLSCHEVVPRISYGEQAITIDLRFERVQEFCTAEGPLEPVTVDVMLAEPVGGRAIRPPR